MSRTLAAVVCLLGVALGPAAASVVETFEAAGLSGWLPVGPAPALTEKLNHTSGGKRALLLAPGKGAQGLRRDLALSPTYGTVALWLHDDADPTHAFAIVCGNGHSGEEVTVYSTPWTASGGRHLDMMWTDGTGVRAAGPCPMERAPGWHRLSFRWAPEGCSVLVDEKPAWSLADLADGFTFLKVGRLWGAEQPYAAGGDIAWDDIEVTPEDARGGQPAPSLAGIVPRPDYSRPAVRAGVWRDRPLDGRSFWAMTFYGSGSKDRPLSEVLRATRQHGVGEAWLTGGDFGDEQMGTLREYAATPGPLIVIPDAEAMQNGTFRLTEARRKNRESLLALRKGRYLAAMHGEWDNALDFYFGGYPKETRTRRDAYQTWEKHYRGVREACGGQMVSVNGYGFYQHYGARWGSHRVIGVEVCENIPGSQSHFAFTRGAARQYGLSWYAQMSPWFAGTILSYDCSSPWRPGPGSGTWGPSHGHSVNCLERHWYAAWLGGANIVCAEAGGWNAFDMRAQNGRLRLSPLGLAWQEFNAFARAHPDRGVPITPFAVVLDQYNGFNGAEKPWRFFARTAGDKMATDVVNQFFPGGFDRGLLSREQGYLTHTPYGDTLDVLLSDARSEVLAAYPVLLCAGDFEPDPAFAANLRAGVEKGATVVVHRSHLEGPLRGLLPPGAAPRPTPVPGVVWAAVGQGRVFVVESAALRIPRRLVDALAQAVLPLKMEGNVEYTLARSARGWVVGLINNEGVSKPSPTDVVVFDPTAAQEVRITYPAAGAGPPAEWVAGTALAPRAAGPGQRTCSLRLRPGEVRVVEIPLK